MHRLVTISGESNGGETLFVEQPSAPVLFLSSANTDISTLAATIDQDRKSKWINQLRALDLASLQHPAQIDHYLSTTGRDAKLIVVRLLGGRGHWSYGLEQLIKWQESGNKRNLIVLSGVAEQAIELNSIGNVQPEISNLLANLLKEGGVKNMSSALSIFESILNSKKINTQEIKVNRLKDVEKWDWQEEGGPKVGVIAYRALLQAGDLTFVKRINSSLRSKGLSPKTIFITSLRHQDVQGKIINLYKKEKIDVVITSTSFASVQFNEHLSGGSIWDELNVPVMQLLTSSRSREEWSSSTRGLDPLDLSMQIALPELDGRITTRPCAFKVVERTHISLATTIKLLKPEESGLSWVSSHIQKWLSLKYTNPEDTKITLVIANYPVRNGRIANGVGLDTPESVVQILSWLEEEGYYLGEKSLPRSSKELMQRILSNRTNDPETDSKSSLDYLPLKEYLKWWNKIPEVSKKNIIKRWGTPEKAIDLEQEGFPIHGINYGNISILIQPSRGYDSDRLSDLHSPDLPPPHRYLAQYHWIREVNASNVIVHVGKHGSLEWLPGKSVGLSNECFPDLAIDSIPNIYPFIVNDPGEGSQAKRRSQAVIIDHLTPPLGKAGLNNELQVLESLLDEYQESNLFTTERSKALEKRIINELNRIHWPNIDKFDETLWTSATLFNELISEVESYLCEIKESQIRTGLHVLGKKPSLNILLELLFLITRAPSINNIGITQWIALKLKLDIDPWADEPSEILSKGDKQKLLKLSGSKFNIKAQAANWLDEQALVILKVLTTYKDVISQFDDNSKKISNELLCYLLNYKQSKTLTYIKFDIWPRLIKSSENEKKYFIKAISGHRIPSGPSGAPTRGRPETLPTGRNFYSVDLRGLPTETAWDLGRRSAENLLEFHLQEHGEPLTSLAVSVWGTATMRNGGEEISQLLALMGVRPVWDGSTRRVIDIEIIPISQLRRPRVDVLLRISGLFRDAFPQLISYVSRAQQIVAALNEPPNMNPYSKSLKEGKLPSRIYGSAPGAYGAGLQELIDKSAWDKRSDLAEAYLNWSQWKYSDCDEPTKDREGLEDSLKGVQVVLHNQDNREHDLLDSDDYYQFQGGLASAVEKVTGKQPSIWFADHSNTERPKVHKLSKEIDKVVRSRLLNERWLDGMKKHGYKGAFELSASLDYLFAYDAATDVVPDWCYSNVCKKWLMDKSIKEFLIENNPWVLRDMAERLLEANNRNMWKSATKVEQAYLKELVNESDFIIESSKFERI